VLVQLYAISKHKSHLESSGTHFAPSLTWTQVRVSR